MQKKLIALAIAGLSSAAFAQSNVTISGQIKTGYENYRLSNGAAGTGQGSQNMLSDETSQIVLKGTEALGNGLEAIFQIDSRFTPDTGNSSTGTAQTSAAGAGTTGTLGSGNTYVGIKSASIGELKAGRMDMHYNEIERIEGGAKNLSQQTAVGRGLLNGVNGMFIGPAQTRTNNAIVWDSANYSGFTFRAGYSFNPYGTEPAATGAAGTAAAKAYNLVGRYENGPIKAGYSYYTLKNDGGLAAAPAANASSLSQTSNRAWGSYKFGDFTVGLAYDRSKLEGTTSDISRNAWALPVSYTTGAHGFYATYAKANNASGSAAPAADSSAKQWVLGYDYTLSKRTSVGVNYTKLDNAAGGLNSFANNKGTAPIAGQDITQFYAGIRHAF